MATENNDSCGTLCPTQADEAHHCKCSHVTRCDIYTHPSKKVQGALNLLMDAMAEFDSETGSASVLAFQSNHSEGVFTSITRRAA